MYQDLSKGERQEFGFLGFYILNIIRTQLNKKSKTVETPRGWRGISDPSHRISHRILTKYDIIVGFSLNP